MAAIQTQQITPQGVAPADVACTSGGDTVSAEGRTFISINNTDSASHNVTVAAQASGPDGLTVGNLVVAVPAGTRKVFGPINEATFGRASDGQAVITYSAVTGMLISALRL